MATNGKLGDNRRQGAIKSRSQTFNPQANRWVKRNDKTGQFMDMKADPSKFKGVRIEQ